MNLTIAAPSDAAIAQSGARFPSLTGRSVFVTGGATGIGAALVSAFTAQGARVAFVDIDSTAGEALVAHVAHAHGQQPWFRACDVRDVEALQASIAAAAEANGSVSVLVNNVADDTRHRLEDVSPEFYDGRIAVNQRPAFFAIQAVVPGMRQLGGGAIVNLGSVGWQAGQGGAYPCYAIAKSSVTGLTVGLARSLGADRIRINTVSPGWVITEKQARLWLDEAGERELREHQCLPDRLRPQDVAQLVMFLAADDGAMCTGQEFRVDAGWR